MQTYFFFTKEIININLTIIFLVSFVNYIPP